MMTFGCRYFGGMILSDSDMWIVGNDGRFMQEKRRKDHQERAEDVGLGQAGQERNTTKEISWFCGIFCLDWGARLSFFFSYSLLKFVVLILYKDLERSRPISQFKETPCLISGLVDAALCYAKVLRRALRAATGHVRHLDIVYERPNQG